MGPPMLKSFRARARPLMEQWLPSLAATFALGSSYWLHFSRLQGRLDRVDSAVHGIAAQAREVVATKVVCEPAAPVNCPTCSAPEPGFAWSAFFLGGTGLCLCQVCCYCCYSAWRRNHYRESVVEQIWTPRPLPAEPPRLALPAPAPKSPVVLHSGSVGPLSRRRGVVTP